MFSGVTIMFNSIRYLLSVNPYLSLQLYITIQFRLYLYLFLKKIKVDGPSNHLVLLSFEIVVERSFKLKASLLIILVIGPPSNSPSVALDISI